MGLPDFSLAVTPRLWSLLGLVWLLVVALLSLLPMPDSGTGVNDKLSHLLTYFFLTSWFSVLINRQAQLLWLVICMLAYGGLIEAMQSLTSYRTAEWADVAANFAGIALAMPLYLMPLHRKMRVSLNCQSS